MRFKKTIYPSRPETHLVFEFCDHDMAGLLANQQLQFSLAEQKNVMKQLLEGVFYLHINKILHRDLKSANILINRNGILKLADFGLARPYSLPRPSTPNTYTPVVVTLWYRPPELLLGEKNYGPAIDVWGIGCVMAELWTRRPIMDGISEQDQLAKIQKLCGDINPESFPGAEKYELYRKLKFPSLKRIIKPHLEANGVTDDHALDLIDQVEIWDI